MKESLAQMAKNHAGLMYRIAYSLLRNTHDAEDAVQDCLLKLLRLGGWEEVLDERAFLAKAVWRCAVGRLPREQIRALESDDESLATTDRTPEASAIVASNEERLHNLVDGLPLDLREPLLLSGFDELTSAQIGKILGIPEGTVRTRIKRAREELRRRW